MMEESPSPDRQPETALARPPKKLVVFVPPQQWIIIEEANRVKNPAMHHKAHTGSDSEPPDFGHLLNECFGILGKIVIVLAIAHRRTDDVYLLFFGKAGQPLDPSRRDQNVIVQHYRPECVRGLSPLV